MLSSVIGARASRKVVSTTKKHNKYDGPKAKKEIPIVAITVFMSLFFISVWTFLRFSHYSADTVIVQDLQNLQKIFKEIDKDCKVIGFEHTKNYIDFLTVKEFVGSQIGSMNVTYPRKWKGPYLQRTPTVNEQQYLILKNKNGYYLVPGDGVVLANGKTIGKDLMLDETSDIDALLQNSAALKSSQGLLAAKIDVESSSSMVKKVQNRWDIRDFDV